MLFLTAENICLPPILTDGIHANSSTPLYLNSVFHTSSTQIFQDNVPSPNLVIPCERQSLSEQNFPSKPVSFCSIQIPGPQLGNWAVQQIKVPALQTKHQCWSRSLDSRSRCVIHHSFIKSIPGPFSANHMFYKPGYL